MKFKCGMTYEEADAKASEIENKWVRWFAWHPVTLGPNDCRWLEFVERSFWVTVCRKYNPNQGYFIRRVRPRYREV